MWIMLCQEDDPDPLFKTMIPMDKWPPILSMLVFAREGGTVRRYNISGTNTKDLYERPYDGQLEEKQWPRLVELVGSATRNDRDQHRQPPGHRRPDAVSPRPPRRGARADTPSAWCLPRRRRAMGLDADGIGEDAVPAGE